MGPANQVQVVLLEEVSDEVWAENVRNSSFAFSPAPAFFIRVAPEQVTKEPSVWDISRPDDLFDLFQAGQVRRQPPMHAEYFVINDCSHWQAVEALNELLPELDVIAPFACLAWIMRRKSEEQDNLPRGTKETTWKEEQKTRKWSVCMTTLEMRRKHKEA